MELLQLKYFCDAALTENFSKTAKRYFVPTSNISQSVKRLEREIGVELFEHHSNKIILSEAGKRFFEKTNEALSLLEAAKAEASSDLDEISGDIKLLIFCNRRLVTKAIEKFKEAYPNVNFILRHEKEAELDCDILISDICPDGYYEHSLLVTEDILLAMSREHKLASKNSLSPKDFQEERFVCMPRGSSLYTMTESICTGAGFNPNITIQTDDPYYVRKYVSLGLGVAYIPSCSWEGLFSDNVILKKVGEHKRNTFICLPKKKNIKASAKAFLQYLK